MTDQVLLQESAAAELQYVCYGQRLQSREHTEYRTYRIQNTEVQHLYWSLVASHCSCVIAGAGQHISAAFAIMQSSVVVGNDHFSFVEAKWWLVVTRNQSYRVEPRGWGIYSFGIAVPILYVCI